MMDTIFKDFCVKGIEWGPGIIIALFMLYGLYRLIKGVGLKIVGALEKPAEALTQQAEALTKQSTSMDRLTGSIQEYVHRDTNEHQEIIILQKVIREELKGIRIQSDKIEQHLGEINHGRS
jgi:hypothetical protein